MTRTTRLTPAACWDRLTDWPRHGDRVPLTRVRAVRGSGHAVGNVILARTAIGPLGFDDPMEIVRYTAPTPGREGLCRLEKRGRIVRGWAELRVDAAGDSGTVVSWVEEIRVKGVPAAFDPVTVRAADFVFGRVLDGLLRSGSRR